MEMRSQKMKGSIAREMLSTLICFDRQCSQSRLDRPEFTTKHQYFGSHAVDGEPLPGFAGHGGQSVVAVRGTSSRLSVSRTQRSRSL
jgi:hypothetical protein